MGTAKNCANLSFFSVPIITFCLLSSPINAQEKLSENDICPTVDIKLTALSGGQSRITFSSKCRANQMLAIEYGGAKFVRKIGPYGEFDFTLDCFAGASEPVEFKFIDGESISKEIAARDLDAVTKVAVIWRGSVNLDLHILEYAAAQGQPGHVWPGAPGSTLDSFRQTEKERRSRGYMSSIASGVAAGDNVEVYTLWHSQGQTGGAIATSLDYESRARAIPDPDSCGSGLFAEIDYRIVIWSQKNVSRTTGGFSSLQCDHKIANGGRFFSKAVPDIFFR